ncbi:MAG: histidinol-phosphatase HisJ family protein [Peptococcaceae bacterium]|nr:histidinol-phosphatase HisJ family protein [Peptococcaceae bacterium]
MMPDYHIHTARCGHARGEMPQYIARAREKGLKEIGFADHVPMYWLPAERRDSGLAMAEDHFPGYMEEVLSLRGEHPDIDILLGVEVDYVPGWEKEASRILSGHPFDYVIGSVHYIDGWAFDSPRQVDGYGRRDIESIYRDYFDLLCRAAASGLFDIIAHPDLVKKFGHRPGKVPTELYRQAAGAFARAGVCVEVNTAGLRYPAGEIYPSLEFLRLCRVEGVPATTGSDAHDPDLVGAGFDQAEKLLLEAGYREVAIFRGRRRKMVRI